MNFKSKSLQVSTLLAVLFSASCNESSNGPAPLPSASNSLAPSKLVNGRMASYSFDGTEGDPIALDIATKWITNFVSSNQNKIVAQYFSAKAIRRILSQSGIIGVRFYYSLDSNNESVVLATGADNHGKDFTSNYLAKGQLASIQLLAKGEANFIGTELDSLTATDAVAWVKTYYSSNSTRILAHFFGNQLLNQLLASNGCVGIRCYYAVNDSGIQQLLIVGVSSTGENIIPGTVSGGRTEDGGGIGDVSSPCPPYCG